jgi:hypothetical protein
MTGPVDVLAVLDVQRELGVKQSTKNANAGFVDWRDWCAFLGRTDKARAALADLIERADNAEKIIRNCVNAGQIGAGYIQHADDLRAALANVGSAS